MHRLIEFIKRIYVVVLFLLMEGGALWCYATSTPYTEAKILSRTTAVGGAVSGWITGVGHFFSLPDENRMLTQRIAELEEQLGAERELRQTMAIDSTFMATIMEDAHFRYMPARVVSMTTNRQRNYLVLDRGFEHGVAEDMCVITPERELVGYIVSVSERYAVVMPMLNRNFSIGGRLTHNGYVCSVLWNGGSSYEVEAIELSVYAEPEVGMTIDVSSERLPEGITIGTIKSIELNTTQTAYSVVLDIAANMATLDNLLIVENTHHHELQNLLEDIE